MMYISSHQLSVIYLEHNPVAKGSKREYLDDVKRRCPHILQIDADMVADSDEHVHESRREMEC